MIGIDRVMSELCYKGTILQSNSKEFFSEIPWEFIFEATACYVQIRIITILRYVIKGLNCSHYWEKQANLFI